MEMVVSEQTTSASKEDLVIPTGPWDQHVLQRIVRRGRWFRKCLLRFLKFKDSPGMPNDSGRGKETTLPTLQGSALCDFIDWLLLEEIPDCRLLKKLR